MISIDPPFDIPEESGRTVLYCAMRACERLDPRAFFGRAFKELSLFEQVQMIAYAEFRQEEEYAAAKAAREKRGSR